MATEFCSVCKPNTKKSCASCVRCKKQREPEVLSIMAPRDRISFMGEIYFRLDDGDFLIEEEYY